MVYASHNWAVKLYGVILNQFNKAGFIHKRMSATSALRLEAFKTLYTSIEEFVLNKAENFKKLNGYHPPN